MQQPAFRDPRPAVDISPKQLAASEFEPRTSSHDHNQLHLLQPSHGLNTAQQVPNRTCKHGQSSSGEAGGSTSLNWVPGFRAHFLLWQEEEGLLIHRGFSLFFPPC